MRRYAEGTDVSVASSRLQIDELLRAWKAAGVQWTDNWENDRVEVRFLLRYEKHLLRARFALQLPAIKTVREQATVRGTFSETKFRRLMDHRGRQEHRILHLWLKAAFNAVAAGIVDVTTLFMPFIEAEDGRTVGEVMMPSLGKMAAKALLPGHVEGKS